ncbi:splicing factor 3B subunit 2-like isoform X2 [Acipenser ruthenus]|uniref:splicing factor 3B subunit 2-like isoform X2 n=1 Tax=Acipenser ruthenus TaxID=7906 RepID=UPI002741B25C|nr:splicing factor 3B subunit 2-like isoform X2 [Acipenser ruthenus]
MEQGFKTPSSAAITDYKMMRKGWRTLPARHEEFTRPLHKTAPKYPNLENEKTEPAMATDGPPGTEQNTPDLSNPAALLNTWSIQELQAKLAEIGAPNMGPREEMIDRLKGYSMQTGILLTKPVFRSDDGDKSGPSPVQMAGMPVPPHSMGLPPGIPQGMPLGFPLGLVGPPPPGMPPPLRLPVIDPTNLSEEDHLKIAQHRAAMLLQQEGRAQQQQQQQQQGSERSLEEHMKDQELLEQQKRAAVLLEHERQQQEMAKMQQGVSGPRGPDPGPQMPPIPQMPPMPQIPQMPHRGNSSAPPPPGVSLGPPGMSHGPPSQRQRGPPPPPPGEDMREGDDGMVGPKIPQALEKILQLKEMRQEQLSTVLPEEEDKEMETDVKSPTAASMSETEEDETTASKKDKNRKRRNRKKKKKKEQKMAAAAASEENGEKEREKGKEAAPPEVEIEYVTEEPQILDPNFIFFKRIFEAFKLTDDVKKEKEKEPEKTDKLEAAAVKKKGFEEEKKDSDSDDDSDEDLRRDVSKMSKKKLRRMNRLTVAELKQLVARPDVVEMHDVTAQEPKLLVHLKATRNTVPVPRHWCFKRKYLQGKRGIEKPPFELPEFIKRTGIQEMREALQEKEEAKTMKTKMREKVRPKMGKIDIDYQKLHDAFFKWQMKPKLTIHGDLYYEGKEFETRLKEKKPGDLSDELRNALGMPVGPNSHKVPPPWLIAMQRYGPPPSYPNLKIPGLNSPIPEGCSFGYHAGGWGKPPVDEMGKPLYGDVFGTNAGDFQTKTEEEEIDRTPWGELEASDEESSEEEEEEESDEEKPDESGFITPADSGLITPGGFTSVPAGMETPELIELRKKKIEEAMDGNETPQLFTVLPEKRPASVGTAMMGSTHIYDVSSAVSRKGASAQELQGVEVALTLCVCVSLPVGGESEGGQRSGAAGCGGGSDPVCVCVSPGRR